ncbi:alpha/beta hydrolase [Actinorhabdospora filicis]|uniref:Alpha/beta hydrolase n=1 Tax=Actinorhabdospora filicis TaxID=1785913 RepID=A0A9W6WB34_9ACTN|nr:alpha/beta hydrolase [Actinorhabdospora filicis]GLZ79673.1 alpha/beta hydrolase [Actinorhabdospora filicis]
MQFTTSADGTKIAYDIVGEGTPVVLVAGAIGHRAIDPVSGALAGLLARRHTVLNYDRRGRGDSVDTAPYAVEREIEDLNAVIEAAGGEAAIYGISSGAVLAIRAAGGLPGITRLAVYEPPVIVDDSRPPLPGDYVEQLDALLDDGRSFDALALFMTAAVGAPVEYVDAMRGEPFWPGMAAVAHTLAYDGRVMGETMSGRPLPAEWADITVPALVIDGGASDPYVRSGADALGALLPNASRVTLDGQTHMVDPAVLAPVLLDFFAA